MKHRKLIIVLALIAAALLPPATAQAADKIVDSGNVPRDGTIQGIKEQGIALLWSATNTERVFPLSQIKSIAADGLADLEPADQALAAGDPAKAATLYDRAKLRASKPWMKDYINARLVQAYGDSDRFSLAVKCYVELVQAKSPLATQVRIPAVRDAKGREADAALAAINAAMAAGGANPGIERLKEIKISLLIQRGDPKDVLPMIEEQLKSADVEIRSQARLKQIELQIQSDQPEEALKNLAKARAELDAMHQPRLFFFEGRCLFAQQKYLEAGLSFMRVPVQFPMGKELAAESLVWAARSLQKAGAPINEVASALQEARTEFAGTPGAAEAEKMLAELAAPQAPQQ